jgi:O-antigen ligase
LNEVAIEAWKQNPGRVFFGVGLGGAGVAINRQDGSYSAKEIIQNQYLSILLELGCFGLAATVLTLGGAAIFARQKKAGAVFWALFLAYLISLCFFSGLPNVLHIYLLMPAWVGLGGRYKYGKIS